jgi:rhodanese-related sulfurtransferase
MKANELLKRIESKSAPVIIDARTGIEFKRGHVPGAINAPTPQNSVEDDETAQGHERRDGGLL